MGNPILIAALLGLIAGLFAYAILVPRNTGSFAPDNQDEQDTNMLLKLAIFLGNEFYSSLPQGVLDNKVKRKTTRIDSLLIRSGNPWNLSSQEFIFFQYVSAFIGFALSWPIYFIIHTVIAIPIFIVIPAVTAFAFFIPRLKYRDQAKKRDLEFKKQLPEALDLIIISLSGRISFAQAIREALPNMQEGVLKEEFKEINRAIETGKTMNEALDNFARRAPNENIISFIRSVQEANSNDRSLVDTLKARSEESRQELMSIIQMKTAVLDSKIMGTLTPTLIPALMIVLALPSIYSLIASLT